MSVYLKIYFVLQTFALVLSILLDIDPVSVFEIWSMGDTYIIADLV